jgi:hypothetical protein
MEASHRTSCISGSGASVVTFWADDMRKVLAGVTGTGQAPTRLHALAALGGASDGRPDAMFGRARGGRAPTALTVCEASNQAGVPGYSEIVDRGPLAARMTTHIRGASSVDTGFEEFLKRCFDGLSHQVQGDSAGLLGGVVTSPMMSPSLERSKLRPRMGQCQGTCSAPPRDSTGPV